MKKLIVVTLLCAMAGCTSEVTLSDGKTHACVGVNADKDKEPGVKYRANTFNAVVSILFIETIFAPVVWLLSDFQCPYALEGKSTI